jgi:hypothetical protein
MSHSPNVCRRESGDSIEHRRAQVDETSLRAWRDDHGPRRACRRRFLSSLRDASSLRSHVMEGRRQPLRSFLENPLDSGGVAFMWGPCRC